VISDVMACAFISVKRLYIVEEVTSISVLNKVDWVKSIVSDKAAIINV